jgi:hypothetical protein
MLEHPFNTRSSLQTHEVGLQEHEVGLQAQYKRKGEQTHCCPVA